MNNKIKKKKMINIFSNGSFLITKNVFSKKINFIEKDFTSLLFFRRSVNINVFKDLKIKKLEYK